MHTKPKKYSQNVAVHSHTSSRLTSLDSTGHEHTPEARWEGSSSGAERSLVTAVVERDVVWRWGHLIAAWSHAAGTRCAGQSGEENETLSFLQFQGNMCWDMCCHDQIMAREEAVVTVKSGAVCHVL